jgi:hypothetical protein
MAIRAMVLSFADREISGRSYAERRQDAMQVVREHSVAFADATFGDGPSLFWLFKTTNMSAIRAGLRTVLTDQDSVVHVPVKFEDATRWGKIVATEEEFESMFQTFWRR